MLTQYKILRVQSDLTQQEVEKLIGISQPTLSQIERGVLKPSDDQVRRLGQVYGIEDAETVQTES